MTLPGVVDARVSLEAGVSCNKLKEAMLDPVLFTVIEYVSVVEPSCAVTRIVISVPPVVFSAIAGDADPDGTVVPFTCMVALGSAVVGIMVTEETELATDAL